MKPKIIIGIIAILAILLTVILISFSHKNGGLLRTPTNTPSLTHTETLTPTSTATFMVVCTPPRCAIGNSETYYCSGVCPGGCGTTCATYTPTP
jgi:hypothetical protein